MTETNRKLKARIIEIYGTQADFAEALGISPSIISLFTRGRKRLTAERAREWAALLHCEPEDITGPPAGAGAGSADSSPRV